MAQLAKNPPATAGDKRDVSSIPESGRSPGEGMATHSGILAWRIPGTDEPGGLQSMHCRESDTTGHAHTHTHTHNYIICPQNPAGSHGQASLLSGTAKQKRRLWQRE